MTDDLLRYYKDQSISLEEQLNDLKSLLASTKSAYDSQIESLLKGNQSHQSKFHEIRTRLENEMANLRKDKRISKMKYTKLLDKTSSSQDDGKNMSYKRKKPEINSGTGSDESIATHESSPNFPNEDGSKYYYHFFL